MKYLDKYKNFTIKEITTKCNVWEGGSFNENVDNREFSIKDAYLSAIALIDDGFIINFYDPDLNYLGTDDIDKETDKYKNFKLYKNIGNYRENEFTLEVTNHKASLSFEDFATIINDMVVTIEDIENKGWKLSDFFASPDDDSVGVRFYHIRFVFTKPKELISNKIFYRKSSNRIFFKK